MDSQRVPVLAIGLIAVLSGCVTVEEPARPPGYRPLTAAEGRALVARLLPESVKERSGWAIDIYAAFAVLDLRRRPRTSARSSP